MSERGVLKVHKALKCIPEATDDELAILTESIRANGVMVPICTWCGEIIDGRARYKIAKRLGIPCPAIGYDIDKHKVVSLVISLNLDRRGVTPAQREEAVKGLLKVQREIAGPSPWAKPKRPAKRSTKAKASAKRKPKR